MYTLFLFLPFLILLIWAAQFILFAPDKSLFLQFESLALSFLPVLFYTACYMWAGCPEKLLFYSDLLSGISLMCYCILGTKYMYSLFNVNSIHVRTVWHLLLLIPLVMFFIEATLCFVLKFEQLADIKVLWIVKNHVVPFVICAFLILFLFCFVKESVRNRGELGNLRLFLLGKGSVSVAFLQGLNIALSILLVFQMYIINRDIYLNSFVLSVLLVLFLILLVFSITVTSFMCQKKDVILYDYLLGLRVYKSKYRQKERQVQDDSGKRSHDFSETIESTQYDMKSETQVTIVRKERNTGMAVEPQTEDGLLKPFEKLMLEEEYFRKPGITLDDIARELDSNKTYISRLVHKNYNVSFPDYLNGLRISYAQRYMLNNVKAKQAEVASVCGFPNAPALNSAFKKITGVTPKIWLATKNDSDGVSESNYTEQTGD